MVKSNVENLQRSRRGKKQDSDISTEIHSDLQVMDRTSKDVRNKWYLFTRCQK